MLRQSVRPPTTDQRGRDKHCRAEWASGWGSQLHGGGDPAPTQKPLLTPPCWRGLSLSRVSPRVGTVAVAATHQPQQLTRSRVDSNRQGPRPASAMLSSDQIRAQGRGSRLDH
jgi:hypothetical protein